MKNKLRDKKNIIIILLSIILIISLGYIGLGFFYSYQNAMVLEGYSLAIRELISTAKNEECNVIPIIFDEEAVQVINIECLQQEGAEGIEQIMEDNIIDE